MTVCDTAEYLLMLQSCTATALHVALCVTAKLVTAAVQRLYCGQVPPPTLQGSELLPALSACQVLPIASDVRDGGGPSTSIEQRLLARGVKYWHVYCVAQSPVIPPGVRIVPVNASAQPLQPAPHAVHVLLTLLGGEHAWTAHQGR